MILTRPAGALALALLVAACGEKQNAAQQNETAKATANEVYSGTGAVKSIIGDHVANSHGPISGIGWPAMTMTFTAPPDIAPSLKVGAKVDFSFRNNGSAYVLTSGKPR